MTIIEKLEKEALEFMNKRLPIEKRLSRDILDKLEDLFSKIKRNLKQQQKINISSISSIIRSEIQPLFDDFLDEVKELTDTNIRNNYEIGQNQSYNFFKVANIEADPRDVEDLKEETLLALLLYSNTLIENFINDIKSNLEKDITSIYILNKNLDKESQNNPENERYADSGAVITTVLSGAIISRYIDSRFKNYSNRAEVISQTETNRALNTGAMVSYLALKRNHSSLKVKWIEVRDSRLCRYCRDAANGGDYGEGVYDIGTVTPPPLHARCRCILVPFLDHFGNGEY